MASLLRAQAEKADSAGGKAEGDLPTKCQPSGKRGDRADQSDCTGLGELFCHRRLESMLFVCSKLGGKEDSVASDACPGALGFRLATVEYEVAVRGAWSSCRLQASSTMVISESPAGGSGLITLDGETNR